MRRIPSLFLASLGGLLFALPVIATWQSGGVPSILQFISAAILLMTIARPQWGLLALAFFLPLTPYIAAVTQAPVGRMAVAEIVLAPFLLGATLRMAVGSGWPAARLAGPALVLGSLAVVDGVLGLAARQQLTTWPVDFVKDLWLHVWKGYFEDPRNFAPFHETQTWIEGITLAVIAERLLGLGRRGWPAVLLAGASVVAATSWLRLLEISLRREQPLSAAINFLQTERIQTLFTDVNAAASLYALFFVPAAWLALHGGTASTRAARWRAHAGYGLAAIVLGLALFMPHSRASYAGAIIALSALWLGSRRFSRTLVAGAALAGVLLIVAVLLNTGSHAQVSSGRSMGIRWDMGKIALQITAQQPVFGIGLGQFRQASRELITPELQANFPATASGENAHNNFLQILAELGLAGLAAFLWMLVSAAQSAVQAQREGRLSAAQLGLVGGLVAFLVSCLAGHPFLTTEVLWAFFLVLGAMVGFGPAQRDRTPPRSVGRLALGLTLMVVALAPVRIWLLQHSDLKRSFIGAGPLTHEGSDIPYRRVGTRSVWLPPARTRIAILPLRVTAASPASCLVRVNLDGNPVNVVEATPHAWLKLTMMLAPQEAGSPPHRLELWVDNMACRLMFGEPAYHE